MPSDHVPGETGQLEALLDRWQTSLDLHARYAALDEARYWHVQPWPRHERPQRWIIQLARKRILALRRLVAQRQSEGDRDFIEGIEIMGFLATLVGITSMERFIPQATHETERRDVLSAELEPSPPKSVPAEKPVAAPAESARARTGEHKRTAETTRQMPALPSSRMPRREPDPPPPRREAKREPVRPAAIKPQPKPQPPVKQRKAPATVTATEHVVIADAVRLLGWGRQWHELAEMIARLSERPSPSEIRRILRTYRDQIDAVATRRRD